MSTPATATAVPFSVPDADLAPVGVAAAVFRLNQSTIRRWINLGYLPAYRLGPRMLRVKMSEVAAMLQPVVVTGGAHDDD